MRLSNAKNATSDTDCKTNALLVLTAYVKFGSPGYMGRKKIVVVCILTLRLLEKLRIINSKISKVILYPNVEEYTAFWRRLNYRLPIL
jgi:hypothetical protein